MNVQELPPKEVFSELLTSKRLTIIVTHVRDHMCTVLDNENQGAQWMLQMETQPRKTDTQRLFCERKMSCDSHLVIPIEQFELCPLVAVINGGISRAFAIDIDWLHVTANLLMNVHT